LWGEVPPGEGGTKLAQQPIKNADESKEVVGFQDGVISTVEGGRGGGPPNEKLETQRGGTLHKDAPITGCEEREGGEWGGR